MVECLDKETALMMRYFKFDRIEYDPHQELCFRFYFITCT